MNYQNSLRQQSAQEKNAPATTPSTTSTPTSGGWNRLEEETDIRISAIEENNQLMIMATPC